METILKNIFSHSKVFVEKNEPFWLLHDYLPKGSYQIISKYLENRNVIIKIKPPRRTKSGDFSVCRNEENLCRITINDTGNKYEFLITLVHEIAHMNIYHKYKWDYQRLKPHGHQWKFEFKNLMKPLLDKNVFPEPLWSVLSNHMVNPKASTSTDVLLIKTLRKYAPQTDQQSVQELSEGDVFLFKNGNQYTRGRKRIKRIECTEISTGKKYLFHPEALVVSL